MSLTAALFVAGVLPGVLLAAAFLALAALLPGPRAASVPTEVPPLRAAFVGALPALAMPLIIVGGMLSGAFTATEASVVAVLYAVVVDGLLYREISARGLWRALVETGTTTGVVLFVLSMTEALGWVFARQQIPQELARWFLSLSTDPVVLLLLVNVLLLLVGIPIETAPALILLTPTLMPLVRQLGIDPVHFGMVILLNLVIGLVTPPVGASLFVVSAVSGVPLDRLSRAILPFIGAAIVVLLLMTYVPWMSLVLPRALLR